MRKLEPDLVIEIDESLFVFDVKYKAFDSQFGVKREDLFSATYLHRAAWKCCRNQGIVDLFTLYQKNDGLHLTLKKTQGVISDIIQQQGKEIPFHCSFSKNT